VFCQVFSASAWVEKPLKSRKGASEAYYLAPAALKGGRRVEKETSKGANRIVSLFSIKGMILWGKEEVKQATRKGYIREKIQPLP